MKKARIIAHLTELDNIRRDEYMPEEIIEIVIELEKKLTQYLAKELDNPSDRRYDYAGGTRPNSGSIQP